QNNDFIFDNRGDTQSPVCSSRNNHCRLDLRVTSKEKTNQAADISLAEYTRSSYESKYFKDKKKLVIASQTHLKEHLKDSSMSLAEAKRVTVPFILTMGLESEMFIIHLVDMDWLVLKKVGDVDIPMCVEEVKAGAIGLYLCGLKGFKVCMSTKLYIFV
ncbi:hypothetical protein BDF14DRAFT_1729685, partial [Spinellus fusiger]